MRLSPTPEELPEVQRLLAESQARPQKDLAQRELRNELTLGGAFVLAAVALAVLGTDSNAVDAGEAMLVFVGLVLGAGFGFGKTKVKVDVIYNGEESVESTKLTLRRFELAPTDRFSLDESAFGLDPVTENASVRLVLTPSGGTAVVDDVYIDPRMRN